MIPLADRRSAVKLVEEAVAAGARRGPACAVLGIHVRTLQRWEREGLGHGDRRPLAERPVPAHALTSTERARILEVANMPAYASLPPAQIVPRLADSGEYIASESSFYRVLKADGQLAHRGRARAPQKREVTTHAANGPNQVWCWDITWLPGPVKGTWYYWYMMLDLHSRYIVASEVQDVESSELAAELLQRATLSHPLGQRPRVLHSDNGGAMKGATMLATMQTLGVVPSFSRPRVSDDNAYAEALFRNGKYCALWPQRPFTSLEEAREWVLRFTRWYNHEHRHSALRFVTPAQRHRGLAPAILQQRKAVYERARQRHPRRWSRDIRNWNIEPVVWLNRQKATTATTLAIAA
jgi:putative transposase